MEINVDGMLGKMTRLGHDGFCLRAGGRVIYVDPFRLSADMDLPLADIILITHEHYDHCSVEDIALISKDSTVFVTEPQAAGKLSGEVRTLRPGESVDIYGIQIEGVHAYNTNKKFHPESNQWLGFIITVDGVRLYHAGDTDHIPEMKNLKVDIALLPVSGTYVMTAAEAVQAALDINPKVAVPMHYGTLCGTAADAEEFAHGLAGKVRVEIL